MMNAQTLGAMPLFQMIPVHGRVKRKVVRYEKVIDEETKKPLVIEGKTQYQRVEGERIDDAGMLIFLPKGNSIHVSKREAIELRLNRSGATAMLGLSKRELYELPEDELQRLGEEVGVPMFSDQLKGVDLPMQGTGNEKVLVDGRLSTLQEFVNRKHGVVEVATLPERATKQKEVA